MKYVMSAKTRMSVKPKLIVLIGERPRKFLTTDTGEQNASFYQFDAAAGQCQSSANPSVEYCCISHSTSNIVFV